MCIRDSRCSAPRKISVVRTDCGRLREQSIQLRIQLCEKLRAVDDKNRFRVDIQAVSYTHLVWIVVGVGVVAAVVVVLVVLKKKKAKRRAAQLMEDDLSLIHI